jgi:predicted ArsR family transcriptional regulator
MSMPQPDQQVPRRRGQVLRLLRDAEGPVAIAEVAEQLGIHVNTARFHLEGLVSNGQAERTTAGSRRPGRPAQLFQAVRRMDPMGARHFRVLAGVLAEAIATDPDGSGRVLKAGRSLGRHLASTATGTNEEPDTADPVEQLTRLLDELGFAAERAAGSDRQQIVLRQCPFLELAVDRSDVVCPVHLGLMQGAMRAWGSPVTVGRLDPFVRPDVCVAHLRSQGAS